MSDAGQARLNQGRRHRGLLADGSAPESPILEPPHNHRDRETADTAGDAVDGLTGSHGKPLPHQALDVPSEALAPRLLNRDHSRFVVIASVVAVPSAQAVCSAFTVAMRRYGCLSMF